MVMEPAVTSYRRGTSWISALLPLPVMPTSAMVSPGRTVQVDVLEDGLVRRVLEREGGVVEAERALELARACAGLGGLVMVLTESITSKWRSRAVLAVRAMASSIPENSTGAAMTAAVAKKATRAPMLSWPLGAEHDAHHQPGAQGEFRAAA